MRRRFPFSRHSKYNSTPSSPGKPEKGTARTRGAKNGALVIRPGAPFVSGVQEVQKTLCGSFRILRLTSQDAGLTFGRKAPWTTQPSRRTRISLRPSGNRRMPSPNRVAETQTIRSHRDKNERVRGVSSTDCGAIGRCGKVSTAGAFVSEPDGLKDSSFTAPASFSHIG